MEAQDAGQRLGLHNHARSAAVGAIVHMAVLVAAEVSRIVKAEFHQSALARATHESR